MFVAEKRISLLESRSGPCAQRVTASAAVGCGGSQPPIAGLESPDKLTVYSPDSNRSKGDTAEEKLGEYRILEKVEIKDAQEPKAIAAAIQEAVVHLPL